MVLSCQFITTGGRIQDLIFIGFTAIYICSLSRLAGEADQPEFIII